MAELRKTLQINFSLYDDEAEDAKKKYDSLNVGDRKTPYVEIFKAGLEALIKTREKNE